MKPLLLHSISELQPIPTDIFRIFFGPQREPTVLEIGMERGGFTRTLLDFGAHVVSIDPTATKFDELDEVRHKVIQNTSITVLNALVSTSPAYQAVIIDGDHNRYTVANELRLMHEWWEKCGTPNRIALLHDVGWPCGGRDFYYDPKTIPSEHVHEPDWENGVVWGDPSLQPYGFRGAGKFAISKQWGPDHGVMGGVTEFFRTTPGSAAYDLHVIPSVFGLGVLAFGMCRLQIAKYVKALPLGLMSNLEENRCRLYCEVLRQHYFARR